MNVRFQYGDIVINKCSGALFKVLADTDDPLDPVLIESLGACYHADISRTFLKKLSPLDYFLLFGTICE